MADKQTAQALLRTSRRRVVGSIMGHLEREVYPRLSRAEQEQLRTKVIASVDAYHDFALDLVGVYADEQPAMVNDVALGILHEIRDAVT